MPLSPLRILDLTRLLPGPYCTMFFSDFGAEVIKVEQPIVGDYLRERHPKVNGQSAIFNSINRNKKSISLNLKTEIGKEIFKKLAKDSDIIIESFRPGVMDRLGLGYVEIKKINPKIIYCAITGYGQTGPYAHYPGHDINFLSYAGALGLQGKANETPSLSSALQIADLGGAHIATIGILLAMKDRDKSGKGKFIDISLTDNVISMMQMIFPTYLTDDTFPRRGTHRLGGGKACYNLYETLDNRFLAVGALEEKFWQEFCLVIQCPHLIDELDAPYEKQVDMIEEITKIIKMKTLSEWLKLFEGISACVSPVLNVDEVVNSEYFRKRNMLITKDSLSKEQQVRNPIIMNGKTNKYKSDAPSLGEHNQEVLAEIGLSINEIHQLAKSKIL